MYGYLAWKAPQFRRYLPHVDPAKKAIRSGAPPQQRDVRSDFWGRKIYGIKH